MGRPVPRRYRRDSAQALELALHGGRHVGPVLLGLQLRLDADLFEIALHQLRVIDEVAGEPRRHPELRLKSLGIPRFGQQAPGLLGIVRIVPGALAELIGWERPLHRPRARGRSGRPRP